MKPQLLIWGAAGHARVVADAVRKSGEYEIVGFLDDDPARHQEEFSSGRIVGGGADLPELVRQGATHLALAVGNNAARLALAKRGQEAGLVLATIVHPGAIIGEDVQVGRGTFIAAGAILAPNVKLGEQVIVNTAATVDHDSIIGDGVHLSPGVHLAGWVTVGRCAWLGVGAVVRDRLTIGERSIIGAGSAVVKDIPAGVVAYGCPARVIRPV